MRRAFDTSVLIEMEDPTELAPGLSLAQALQVGGVS